MHVATDRAMTVLQSFLRANRVLSARFDARRDAQLYQRYDQYVADALRALPSNAVVVDLGGGRTCSFAEQLQERSDLKIIAVDISGEELEANTVVDEKRVADVAMSLPFRPGSVDLIVSRTLLEHVDGVPEAIGNIHTALKQGGRTFHLVPCRYALFALAARLINFDVARRVLHVLIPEAKGVVEFEVYYDHCHPRALASVFERAGFKSTSVECTWDQSDYFKALFPVFVLVYAYQRFVEAIGVRTLASYVVVQATR